MTYEELYIVLVQIETILNSHHIPAAERVGANIHYIIISIIFIIGKLIQNLFYHIYMYNKLISSKLKSFLNVKSSYVKNSIIMNNIMNNK